MAVGRGRNLIIQFPPTLTIYSLVHSLPLGRVGRGFPFSEAETQRHFSYLSGTIREPIEYDALTLADKFTWTLSSEIYKGHCDIRKQAGIMN